MAEQANLHDICAWATITHASLQYSVPIQICKKIKQFERSAIEIDEISHIKSPLIHPLAPAAIKMDAVEALRTSTLQNSKGSNR
jgi:hypothetical protein